MKIKCTLLLSLCLLASFLNNKSVLAQPSYITPGGTSNNNYPFNDANNNKVQWVFAPTEFTPGLVAGMITHVYFRTANSQSTTKTFNDLQISIKEVNYSTFSTGNFEASVVNCYGPTTTTISIPSDGWFGVKLATPFVYDGTSNLIIEAIVTNQNSLTVAQNSTNGNKRVWGAPAATSGGMGTGQTACGLEIITCSTEVTKSPLSTTVCETDNFTLEMEGEDIGTYQWQVGRGGGTFTNVADNANYSGSTTATLQVSNVPLTVNNAVYRCRVSRSACVDSTDEATITVNGLVKMEPFKSKDTTCLTATKDLTIKGTGAIEEYKWQVFVHNVGFIDVPEIAPYTHLGNTLRITNVPDTLDGGRFRVILNGICDTLVSNELELEVEPIPYVGRSPQDITTKQGTNVTFTVEATSAGARYIWQVATPEGSFVNVNDGGVYQGVRTDRLLVRGASRAFDGFKFRCVILSPQMCNAPGDTSDFAVLTVEQPAGINNVNGTVEMMVYPNPSNASDVFINTDANITGRDLKYRIMDKTGRLILTGDITANNTRVNISALPADLYLVQLVESGKLIGNTRFTRL